MDWKLTGDRPIWLQLKEQITQRIILGEYPMGSRLPTVRELATEAGVNPNTMQRALAELETDGLAESNRTAGRLVTTDAAAVERIRSRMAGKCIDDFYEGMSQLGYDHAAARKKLEEETEDGE